MRLAIQGALGPKYGKKRLLPSQLSCFFLGFDMKAKNCADKVNVATCSATKTQASGTIHQKEESLEKPFEREILVLTKKSGVEIMKAFKKDGKMVKEFVEAPTMKLTVVVQFFCLMQSYTVLVGLSRQAI